MTKQRPLFPPQVRREKLRNKGTDLTRRLTINGVVALRLRRSRAPEGGSLRPGEQILGLPLGQPSVQWRQMACELGVTANSSFARQERLFEKLGMGPVSREKLRQLVEAEGQRVQEAQQQQQFALNWQASGCPDAQRQGSLVCMGVDGTMTRQITDEEKRKRRKKVAKKRAARINAGEKLKPLALRNSGTDGPWKEVKIVVAYQQHHEHRHWRSTTENHLMAAILITQVARRVRMACSDVSVAMVDGAEWIEGRLRDHLPDLTAIILDFFHLAEHVHTAAREVFGEGTQLARDWANQLLTIIRHQGFAAFDAMLEKSIVEHARSPGACAAVTKLRQYVRQRQDMVDYPYFESQGWPIGSGPTESMAGILTARIKGRGRRWDATHIDAVMALQALDIGDEWQAYWQIQTQRPDHKLAA